MLVDALRFRAREAPLHISRFVSGPPTVPAPAIANGRLQPQQPVDAVSARVLTIRRGARRETLVAWYARASLHRVKLHKPVQELVQGLQVVAAAVRITELQPEANPA